MLRVRISPGSPLCQARNDPPEATPRGSSSYAGFAFLELDRRLAQPSSTRAAVAGGVDQALQPARHSGQVHPGALGQPGTVESIPTRPAGRSRTGGCCREERLELNSERMFVPDQLV